MLYVYERLRNHVKYLLDLIQGWGLSPRLRKPGVRACDPTGKSPGGAHIIGFYRYSSARSIER